MEWAKISTLINEATETTDVTRVKEIIEEIQKDETVNPHFIEAIQSGLSPKMFNKLYK